MSLKLEGKLSAEEVERICADEREDWQRKVNQGAIKQSLGGGAMALNEQIQALGAMEAIDKLKYALLTALRQDSARKTESRRVVDRMYEVSPINRRRKEGA